MKKVTSKETFLQCPYCKGAGTVIRRWTEGEPDRDREIGQFINRGFETVSCSFCKGEKIIFSHKEVITEEEV